MTATRSRDTAPELALRSAVHRLGLRYRVSAFPLPALRRTADLVFSGPKVAVFVDGCWWHGCPQHSARAKANSEFWERKIARNQARDRDTDERLTAADWTVIRVWEHEDPIAAAGRVERAVRGRER